MKLNRIDIVGINERVNDIRGALNIAANATKAEFKKIINSCPNKTFSRAQLLDEFWGADSQTGFRAVDVYVTNLRSKLSGCDGFSIVTVRGLGYKAVPVS